MPEEVRVETTDHRLLPSSRSSLKRLHLQHNQIRTIPFLKVLHGRQIVQEFSKAASKRKQSTTGVHTSANPSQHGLGASNDELIRSTIFEEAEDASGIDIPHPTTAVVEEEDISWPAFPELQYLDISSNLVNACDTLAPVTFSPPCVIDRRRG